MESIERYRKLNNYLKEKFGERTLKICIDGGFTCPNRDGTCGVGGCIFCSERGSGEHIKKTDSTHVQNDGDILLSQEIASITKQVENYFQSYKAKRANKFIAYFQNFTNTYDSIENLKLKYDAALIDDRIVALAVATRPDCIDENVAKLLHSYSDKYYVWVELGLQTSNDNTGLFLNRGYSSADFTKSVEILNKYDIDVVAHIMVGLPNETFDDLKNTVSFLNSHHLQGLKIHSTYVAKHTVLANLYEHGLYLPISLEDYLSSLVYVLTHVSPDLVIHRISGDAPKDLLVAPAWNSHKKLVLNGLYKLLSNGDLYQGMFFGGE